MNELNKRDVAKILSTTKKSVNRTEKSKQIVFDVYANGLRLVDVAKKHAMSVTAASNVLARAREDAGFLRNKRAA